MYDVIILGGGPAGTAAAITAARLQGASGRSPSVLLLERGIFPRQKVCGEFVSAEAQNELRHLLGARTELLDHAPRLTRARIFVDGRAIAIPIGPPAAGIARWELDHALWCAAASLGVDSRQRVEARRVESAYGVFTVSTSAGTFLGRSIVDAAGRWSKLRAANGGGDRGATWGKPKWLGLKAHFSINGTAPVGVCAASEAGEAAGLAGENTDLYFFDGGYCGVQPAAEGRLNVCAMVRAERATRLADVFLLHPRLRARSREWVQATEQVAAAPLVFHAPQPECDAVLRAGDAAGFIDPFVGDGISLALRGGRLAAEILARFWNAEISLEQAARHYRCAYRRRFASAFHMAARIRAALNLPPAFRSVLLQALRVAPVAEYVVRSTR